MYDKEIKRGLELYNSMDVMRGAIEQSLDLPDKTSEKIIQTGLSAARNSLLVAFDFDIEATWTICIYKAQKAREPDKATLRCVAHERSIRCEISEAREWPEGVGFAGVSYSMGNEVIIPDLAAEKIEHSIFAQKENFRRDQIMCATGQLQPFQYAWAAIFCGA